MKPSKYEKRVNLPEVVDFLSDYSRYSSIAAGNGKRLFELIMQPEVFIRASVMSDIGLPAVLAVASDAKQLASTDPEITLDSFTKQYIGAAICSLMEANGYSKTGRKRRVPHESFSVGECYQRIGI